MLAEATERAAPDRSCRLRAQTRATGRGARGGAQHGPEVVAEANALLGTLILTLRKDSDSDFVARPERFSAPEYIAISNRIETAKFKFADLSKEMQFVEVLFRSHIGGDVRGVSTNPSNYSG